MTLKSFSKTAACLLLVLAFTNTAQAQFRSAIEGAVTDPSGGIVSDAQVTLVNVETGVSQTAKTNSVGSYSFPALPPGKYKITVSARASPPWRRRTSLSAPPRREQYRSR
jgi:hypothetical protein